MVSINIPIYVSFCNEYGKVIVVCVQSRIAVLH